MKFTRFRDGAAIFAALFVFPNPLVLICMEEDP